MINKEEKKIINSCQTCRTPIYEGEPIYSSAKSQGSGYGGGPYVRTDFGQISYRAGGYGQYYRGTQTSENWAQCAWCYDQWQTEVKANDNFWLKWWLGWSLIIIAAMITVTIMLPGIERNTNSWNNLEQIPWYRTTMFSLGNQNIPFLTIIILSAGIFIARLLGAFLQPAVDRYKLRRRPITTK